MPDTPPEQLVTISDPTVSSQGDPGYAGRGPRPFETRPRQGYTAATSAKPTIHVLVTTKALSTIVPRHVSHVSTLHSTKDSSAQPSSSSVGFSAYFRRGKATGWFTTTPFCSSTASPSSELQHKKVVSTEWISVVICPCACWLESPLP